MSQLRRKIIDVTPRPSKCQCCDSTVPEFYVSYRDPMNPGEKLGANPSWHFPTRGGTACSPEHAIKLMTRFIQEENGIRDKDGTESTNV